MSVKIYSKDGCIYCDYSKDALKEVGVEFSIVDMSNLAESEYNEIRDDLIKTTNQKTFPWIYIGEKFIGGYRELKNSIDTLKINDYLKEAGIEKEIELDF